MRRVTALAAAAALTLLAGCSEDQDNSASGSGSGSSSEAESRIKQAVPGTATAAAPSSSTAPSSPPPAPPASGEVNERGNLVMAVGDEGYITDESGAEILNFSVTAITPDIACDSGFDDPPANGHYVGVDMRVTTTSLLSPDDYVSFSEYDFAYIGPDGITQTSVDGNAYTCLADERLFPYTDLGAGQTYVGTIVVDVSATTGALIFVPSVIGGNEGWEWQF